MYELLILLINIIFTIEGLFGTSVRNFDLLINISKQHFYPDREIFILENPGYWPYPDYDQVCKAVGENQTVIIIKNVTKFYADNKQFKVPTRGNNILVLEMNDTMSLFVEKRNKYLFYIDLRGNYSICSCDKYLNTFSKDKILKSFFQTVFLFHYQKNCSREYEIWTRAPWLDEPGQRIKKIHNAYFNKKPNLNGSPTIFYTTFHEIVNNIKGEESSIETFKKIWFEKWNMVDIGTTNKRITIKSTIFIEPASFDLSEVYNVMSMCFVVQKGKEHPKWEVIFWCFHWKVWMWMSVVWILSGGVWYFVIKKKSLSQSLSEVYSLIVSEGAIWLPKLNTFLPRFVAGILMLMSIVLTTGFQSNIFKNMQVPLLYPPIRDMKEIRDQNLTIICKYPSVCFSIFGIDGWSLKKTNDVIYKLFDEMSHQFIHAGSAGLLITRKDRMKVILKSNYTLNDVLNNSNMALITSCESAHAMINAIPTFSKKLHVLEERIGIFPLFLMEFPFVEQMHQLLSFYFESGIGQWSQHMFEWKKLMVILMKEKKGPSVRVFNMDDVQVAFIILFIGLSISTFVFLLECLSKFQPPGMRHLKKSKPSRIRNINF